MLGPGDAVVGRSQSDAADTLGATEAGVVHEQTAVVDDDRWLSKAPIVPHPRRARLQNRDRIGDPWAGRPRSGGPADHRWIELAIVGVVVAHPRAVVCHISGEHEHRAVGAVDKLRSEDWIAFGLLPCEPVRRGEVGHGRLTRVLTERVSVHVICVAIEYHSSGIGELGIREGANDGFLSQQGQRRRGL